MKHTIIIAGIVLASLFTSCQDDYLDAPPKSSMVDKDVFSNLELAEVAVDAINVPFAETNSYRGRFIPFYGLNNDVEWHNSSQSDNSTSNLVNYNLTSTNTQMNSTDNVWAMMYAGIERANICEAGLRTYSDPKPGTAFGYLLGESITLRAVYYADLLKAFGDVPYRFVPVTNETMYLPKTNRDVIYKRLLADLAEAETLVPWPNETKNTSTVQKVNKAFVKSLRARLAMAASGFQQYPDGIHRSKDPELSVANMYKLALKECRDVIGSGKARLESSFEAFWRKYNQENITAGGESLWEIPFASGRGRVFYTFAVRHNSVDQFQESGAGRGGNSGPLPYVFYDYNKADTRRDVTCVPYRYGNATDKVAKQELVALSTWYFGKYRYEWMNRIVKTENDDGMNKIYMRFAEVLLIAAEAANEVEGVAAAKPYLKEIRTRAFAPADQPINVDAYLNNITTKDEMFKAIVNENKFEFTGEMERKQALIRWNLLKTNLDIAKDKMKNLQARTGEYADVPSTLYYRYKATDPTVLDIYGLNRGENVNPGAGYSAMTWVALDETKINSLYKVGIDPDSHQFWPIWQVFIDGSNNQLKNDYGY